VGEVAAFLALFLALSWLVLLLVVAQAIEAQAVASLMAATEAQVLLAVEPATGLAARSQGVALAVALVAPVVVGLWK
jgi:hypothetical protein